MSSHVNGDRGAPAVIPRSASLLAAFVTGASAVLTTGIAASTTAEAKTPGKTYCYHRKCHRVLTLEETRRAVGKRTVLSASHYDDPRKDRFNPRNLTSSGEWFRAGVPDNAASPKLPNGTILLAWNPATRQSVVLRINNAGPYWGNRTLDVSRGAAERLGFSREGVATLHTTVLHAPTKAEATYRKGRRYAAVPGPIGSHASFEVALLAAGRALDSGFPAPPVLPATSIVVAQGPAVTTSDVDGVITSIPASTSEPDALAVGDATENPADAVAETLAPAASPALPLAALAAGRVVKAAARPPRAIRRPITAAPGRPPECQGWAGACTMTVSRSAGGSSRTRVASSSSKRQ